MRKLQVDLGELTYMCWLLRTSVPESAAPRFRPASASGIRLAGPCKTDIIQVDDGTPIRPSNHTRLLRIEYRRATRKRVAR
jgi:hypothetical protein